MMRSHAVLLATTMLTLGMMAGPAAAHHLTVEPVGNDREIDVWIGGPPGYILPDSAQGEGLFPGPPFALDNRQPAAHGKGLVNACEATAPNGVVTISGPGPAPCVHG